MRGADRSRRCGPVTLALCQDVQTEAFDYPDSFFEPRVWRLRRPRAGSDELAEAATLLRDAGAADHRRRRRALLARRRPRCGASASAHGIPVAETQAGKSALPCDHPLNLGAIGVTGTSAANAPARAGRRRPRRRHAAAGLHHRFVGAVPHPGRRLIGLNVAGIRCAKHHVLPLVADARDGLAALDGALGGLARAGGMDRPRRRRDGQRWRRAAAAATAPSNAALPSDAQVIGAVQRAAPARRDIVVCAAGGLPGELHKLWQARQRRAAITSNTAIPAWATRSPAALGVKLARPDREVIVHGRRRQLPDAELRNRHIGDAGAAS